MERVRACRQTFGTAITPSCRLIADHLSARSFSVTWIHWCVINFASKKGVGRQHTAFTSCQNTAFSNDFFLLRVDYALRVSFNWENVILAAYFILRGRETHIDFLRLLFLVFSSLTLRFFHPFPKQRACSQATKTFNLRIRRFRSLVYYFPHCTVVTVPWRCIIDENSLVPAFFKVSVDH